MHLACTRKMTPRLEAFVPAGAVPVASQSSEPLMIFSCGIAPTPSLKLGSIIARVLVLCQARESRFVKWFIAMVLCL